MKGGSLCLPRAPQPNSMTLRRPYDAPWEHPTKGYQCCHDWLERMQIGLVFLVMLVMLVEDQALIVFIHPKCGLARSLEWQHGKQRSAASNKKLAKSARPEWVDAIFPSWFWDVQINFADFSDSGSYICISSCSQTAYFGTGKTTGTERFTILDVWSRSLLPLFFFSGGGSFFFQKDIHFNGGNCFCSESSRSYFFGIIFCPSISTHQLVVWYLKDH